MNSDVDFDKGLFCESARVFSVGDSTWLVDFKKQIATHCSSTTYNKQQWVCIYNPTHEQYLEFLQDENWQGNWKENLTDETH